MAVRVQSAIDRFIRSQGWMDGVAEAVQGAVGKAYEALGPKGRMLKNALHGTSVLGHPLHPAVTDLPIGAWMVGFVADGTGPVDFRGNNDANVMIGGPGDDYMNGRGGDDTPHHLLCVPAGPIRHRVIVAAGDLDDRHRGRVSRQRCGRYHATWCRATADRCSPAAGW